MKRFYSLFVVLAALAVFGAYQTINIGTNPNDGTGDTLRGAFQKVNANFTQVTADFVTATNVPGWKLWLTNGQSDVILTNATLYRSGLGELSFDGAALSAPASPIFTAYQVVNQVGIFGNGAWSIAAIANQSDPVLKLDAGAASLIRKNLITFEGTNDNTVATIDQDGSAFFNSLWATNVVTGSNFVHSTWKWVDILTSGDAIASNPTGDPPVLTQYGTSNYFGYAYFYNDAADGDKSYFTLQSVHKIAKTNAANPDVWVEPHVHVTTTTFAAGTNATFRLDLYYGNVHGYLTNWYAKTNTVSMTNTYQHCVLSFGNLTNNAIFSGRSSVLFKGRVMRIDGGTGDIGANPVWVDSIDIHVPITELGSIGQTGD